MIIVHYVAKTVEETAAITPVSRRVLEAAEPVPPGAVWLDMVEPTVAEDQKVEHYLGCKIPSRADPDFAVPPESYYAENGVRYLHGSFVSEPEGTPDVTDVTFVLTPATLVTVRYDPGDAFEVFGQKLCRSGARTLHPDAVAVGLVNAIINRSARALDKVGVELDSIASTVFRAKGDQGARSQIYSATLDALGREDEKISNLRESLVSIERLLLFLSSEGRSDGRAEAGARGDEIRAARPAVAGAGRKLQGAEGPVPARRDARPHQPGAERHHQALLGAGGHLHAANRHRLDLRHELQGDAGA